MADQPEKLFGTDGFRGPYEDSEYLGRMNAPTLANLAYAYAEELHDEVGERPIIIVGGDTRSSGRELRQAVIAGATAAGAEIWQIGIAPTPVIAWLAKSHGVGAVAVTASHNPDSDNGFKPFAIGGAKFSADRLRSIEQRYRDLGSKRLGDKVIDDRLVIPRPFITEEYVRSVSRQLGGFEALAGQTVVLDCANGAAIGIAPRLYTALGARVLPLGDKRKDTDVINDGCGATNLGLLKNFLGQHEQLTKQKGFLGGLAFDGDADRVMGMSPAGHVVNGNHFMYELAEGQKGIVGTLYTNTGLRRAVRDKGVEFHECDNGDSYVTERLNELTHERGPGYIRGGEFTGHLIDTTHLPSGDGPFIGAWLLTRLKQEGGTLEDLHQNLPLWPEQSVNLKLSQGVNAKAIVAHDTVQGLKTELGECYGDGLNIVLRPSGTEPLIRIWAEAEQPDLAKHVTQLLGERIGQMLDVVAA